jgi:hypothetical protein
VLSVEEVTLLLQAAPGPPLDRHEVKGAPAMLPRPARLCRPAPLAPAAHPRKPRLLDVGRRIPARDRFAPDSPLEGDGFELLVPPQRNSVRARHWFPRTAPPARRGKWDEKSNPASSCGDSFLRKGPREIGVSIRQRAKPIRPIGDRAAET